MNVGLTLPQSFAWWTFFRPGMDAHRLLEEAAAIGYRGVEILDERYWPLVHETGLEIVAICGSQDQQRGLNDRRNHEHLRREIGENIRRAQDNGIRALIVFAGRRVTNDEQAAIRQTADGLSLVADAAQRAGVTLLLEPMNTKIDHPGQQCDHLDWALRVIELLDTPSVKIAYDVYHMQIMEGDIIRSIRRHWNRIGHIQTAGVPGRGRLNDEQELNFRAIARAVAGTGYAGFIGHEFFPPGDPVEALGEAFEICAVARSP